MRAKPYICTIRHPVNNRPGRLDHEDGAEEGDVTGYSVNVHATIRWIRPTDKGTTPSGKAKPGSLMTWGSVMGRYKGGVTIRRERVYATPEITPTMRAFDIQGKQSQKGISPSVTQAYRDRVVKADYQKGPGVSECLHQSVLSARLQ